jgi:hypothetical protein
MVRTKRVKLKKSTLFEPTNDEKARWAGLPDVQAKCKELWMEVLISDAILEKLCRSSDGEYKNDPIAMTVACISDPDKFSQAENPVWKAAYRAAQAQLNFIRRIQRYSKKYSLNMFSIRRTCDVLTLPKE